MAHQHLLDLGGSDVLAAGDDHVAEAVVDVEEAVVVDAAEVAGVQPAVLVGAARRDGRALDEDLAVLDPQVRGQQRAPGGAELPQRVLGRERGHLRRRLGEPVGLDDGGAAPRRLLDHLDRDRAAADEDRARSREVDSGLEQPHELGRDERERA